MKGLKAVLGIALSVSGLGTAVALGTVSVAPINEIAQVEAANSDWGYVGSGQGNSWTPSTRVKLETTEKSPIHSVKTFSFSNGEQFKFMDTDNWGSDIGFSNLKFGNAIGSFSNDGGNIKCNAAGSYDVAISWSGVDSKNYIGIFTANSYSDLNEVQYIYIAEQPNDNGYWIPSKIYAFNGISQFGGWDGKAFSNITDYHYTATVNLAGTYGNIHRIPYTLADNSFLIHNGSGYQTTDTSLISGSAYYYDTKDGSGKVKLANNANLGLAAELITEVEIAREAVSANPSQSIAVYSICGIPQATINSLAAKYNGLNSTAKGYVDASTVTTYTGSYGSGEDTVSYGDIMAKIVSMATRGSGSNKISDFVNDKNAVVITVIISVAITSSVGLFFFIRKRRYN